jgi:hypothetical protein
MSTIKCDFIQPSEANRGSIDCSNMSTIKCDFIKPTEATEAMDRLVELEKPPPTNMVICQMQKERSKKQ